MNLIWFSCDHNPRPFTMFPSVPDKKGRPVCTSFDCLNKFAHFHFSWVKIETRDICHEVNKQFVLLSFWSNNGDNEQNEQKRRFVQLIQSTGLTIERDFRQMAEIQSNDLESIDLFLRKSKHLAVAFFGPAQVEKV